MSSQFFSNDLWFAVKHYKIISKEADVTGMDVIECLADAVASFDTMNHFDKLLALVIFIILLVVITLLALKRVLICFHRTVRQLDGQKATFHNLQHNCYP